MIPHRTRWNGEWLPIPEKSRPRPRSFEDEDDMSPEAWEKAITRTFSESGLRRMNFCMRSSFGKVEALVRTQLRQAAALRLVGEAMGIAAPRDEEGKPAWGDGAHLAQGCPPQEAGFGRVHLQMSPAELAATRRAAAAEKEFPRIAEFERMGYLPRADARRLREIAASEEQVGAWLSLAEHADRGELRRRLRRARKGEVPNEVPDPGLGPRDEPAGPETDADHVLDRTLRLCHLDGETWDRAVRVAGGQARAVLSVPDALRAFVRRAAEELEAGRVPKTLAETVPCREWHQCPISQDCWLETGRGPWAVSPEDLPSGDGVRYAVLGPHRRRVEPSVPTLLEAFPELEDDASREEPGTDAWRSHGLVTWGICPPIGEELPAPAPALEALPSLAASPCRPVAASVLRDDLSTLSPEDAAAVAAAAARAYHAAFSREVETLSVWEIRTRAGGSLEDRDTLLDLQSLLGLSIRCWLDRTRLGARLLELPLLAEAFDAGRVSYGKARAIARVARPEDDALWTRIAEACDPDAVESFVAAVGARARERSVRSGSPLPVPRGRVPLRPLGGKVTVQVRLKLEGDYARALREVRAALDGAAGRPLATQDFLVALAGWYLRLVEKRGHHTVIYHRSPETQGARHPRDLMPPELALAGRTPGARLRLAFGRLPEIPTERREVGRNWKETPGSRYIPVEIETGVRWSDGERCIVPGCGNDRVVQHDHGVPIAEGGFANLEVDHRLCGPCNRGRAAGLLKLTYGPYGTVMVVDRLDRPFGSVTLGTEWDDAVQARIEAEAEAELEGSDHLQAYFSTIADPLARFNDRNLAREPELEDLERLRAEEAAPWPSPCGAC